MANELTGDYDVVTAFSLGAVNRILAAMHSGKRLPHAMSLSVGPPILDGFVTGVRNLSGLATTDPRRVKKAARARASGQLPKEVIGTVDPVVNPPAELSGAGGAPPGGIGGPAIHAGVAQLQFGPPTMKISPNRTDRAEIHTPTMIHYRADKRTAPLPSFMRGDVVTSFGVKQENSPTGPNIVVDVAGPSGSVHFDSLFSSETLTAGQQKFIDRAFTLSLQRSFYPFST